MSLNESQRERQSEKKRVGRTENGTCLREEIRSKKTTIEKNIKRDRENNKDISIQKHRHNQYGE